MATLIRDIKQRGMLDDTLIVWMGEFGRTPGDGNGHFSNAWSTMWAGGGINTGQVIGRTSDTGRNPGGTVTQRPISPPDYIATLCLALGIDIHQNFQAPGQRPMPVADHAAQPIRELLR
jgi:arylsulfatase A-like enzyme